MARGLHERIGGVAQGRGDEGPPAGGRPRRRSGGRARGSARGRRSRPGAEDPGCRSSLVEARSEPSRSEREATARCRRGPCWLQASRCVERSQSDDHPSRPGREEQVARPGRMPAPRPPCRDRSKVRTGRPVVVSQTSMSGRSFRAAMRRRSGLMAIRVCLSSSIASFLSPETPPGPAWSCRPLSRVPDPGERAARCTRDDPEPNLRESGPKVRSVDIAA